MIYSKLSKVFALTALFSIFAWGAFAQQVPTAPQEVKEDFTDKDYETFVKINQEVIPIQQEAEGEMIEAISEKGLEVNRFQELAQAQQAGNITDVSDDPEEIAKFNEAGQEVMKVQEKVQGEIKKKIEDNQMDIQKFQQISMAYNQSETVRNKIDKLLQEGQEESPELP
jgi:hypothetical protein